MKHLSYLILFSWLMLASSFKIPAEKSAFTPHHSFRSTADTFPVPPPKPNMLFYVQRTHNINTIVYELNYNADSSLNATEPIHIYWIRYADDGSTKDLSYLQKKYAYGLSCICIDPARQAFKVNFVSYKKRDIFLMRLKQGKRYRAFMSIHGKLAYLEKVFVKIEGGSFWLPHVTYVEVAGRDIGNGLPVSEKFVP